MKSLRFQKIILFIFTVTSLLFHTTAFGGILEKWTNANAYKPRPVLFLHGFALGNADNWNCIKSELNKYYDHYSDTLTFLETISFNDPNGSIDTYSNGKDGWADKVEIKVREMLGSNKYGSLAVKKLNLVCHSMGGLAAREYITNPKYSNSVENIDKFITIGTPHVGTPLANIKKIEDAATGMHKYVWDIPKNERAGVTIESLKINDTMVQMLRGDYRIEPEGEAVKDMAISSPFLRILNNRNQLSGFKSYAIYGAIWHPFNILFSAYYPSNPWTCGDGIVPRDSQIGIDIMTNYPDITPKTIWTFDRIIKIPADHFSELNYKSTPSEILKFIDSDPPEIEITSPNPGQITEIHETSAHIQGKVYKEYLPADSQLIITLNKEGVNLTYPPQDSFLKASDLWIPNNLDSPVAEFDEIVNFPGNGTYKISCQIKNPAGLTSDIKIIWVKVVVQSDANIIVHCHNPEGKEIAGIQNVPSQSVELYDGDVLIGYGTYYGGGRYKVLPGNHTIKVKFNGMALEQNIDIAVGTTQELTFTFTRTTAVWHKSNNTYYYIPGDSMSGSGSDSRDGSVPYGAAGGTFKEIINPDSSHYMLIYGGWSLGDALSGQSAFNTSSSADITFGPLQVTLTTNVAMTVEPSNFYAFVRAEWHGSRVTVIPAGPPTSGFTNWYADSGYIINIPTVPTELVQWGHAFIYDILFSRESPRTSSKTTYITFNSLNIADITVRSVP